MNRLIIIGNGFDLAHGLKTSYKDFIDWYWDYVRDALLQCNKRIYQDPLLSIGINDGIEFKSWMYLIHFHSDLFYEDRFKTIKRPGKDIIKNLRQVEGIEYGHTKFFERITKSIETKGWVDIENEYYTQLKKYAFSPQEIGVMEYPLHAQLQFIQELLVKYLKSIPINDSIVNSMTQIIMREPINYDDISVAGQTLLKEMGEKDGEALEPERIMLLSFNYTTTARLYSKWPNHEINYIHGELDSPNSIIFGYGDELDKSYKDLLDTNENQYLDYLKSIKYLEADNYRRMLKFIESAPFQVYIMGHSCGNSDRTLLNTIFEHNNCLSIKPFYYNKPDGTTNYKELVQNVTRNFTDMKLMRDRVVSFPKCTPMM